jgi:hypothetical protein
LSSIGERAGLRECFNHGEYVCQDGEQQLCNQRKCEVSSGFGEVFHDAGPPVPILRQDYQAAKPSFHFGATQGNLLSFLEQELGTFDCWLEVREFGVEFEGQVVR